MTPHRLDFGHLDADDVDHRDELVDVVADEIVSEGGVLMVGPARGRTASLHVPGCVFGNCPPINMYHSTVAPVFVCAQSSITDQSFDCCDMKAKLL